MKWTVWLQETKRMRFDAPHPPAYGMQGQALGRPLQASYGRPNPLQADW